MKHHITLFFFNLLLILSLFSSVSFARYPEAASKAEFDAFVAKTEARMDTMDQSLAEIKTMLANLQSHVLLKPHPPIQHSFTIEVPSAAMAANQQGAACPASMTQIATIQDALACLDGVAIAHNAFVDIALKASPLFAYDTVVIDHPNGRQIRIYGDCHPDQHAQRCTIRFKEGSNGFEIAAGTTLAKLQQLVLIGEYNPYSTSITSGVHLSNDAKLLAGESLDVRGFFYGFYVYDHSTATISSSSLHDNSRGLYVRNHSSVKGRVLRATNNHDYGFYSGYGSDLYLTNKSLEQGSGNCGAEVTFRSVIYCDHSCSIQQGVHKTSSDAVFVQW